MFLTRFARKVTIVAREPEFTCSRTIADKVLSHPKIEVKFNSEIAYVRGTNVLKEAKFINNKTNESWVHHCDKNDGTFGVFVFVGYEPISDVFKGHIDLDKFGYIPTNEEMETNVPGVYASGDIRPKRLKQLVTATSDGAIAATAIEKYINAKKEALNIEVEDTKTHKQSENFFSKELITQVQYVLDRCSEKISIYAILADSSLSESIKIFLSEFSKIAEDKAVIRFYNKGENSEIEAKIAANIFPVIALMDKDGKYTGVSFNGVPGGHEMESFMLAIYNIAGNGQAIDESLLQRIKNINKPLNLKIGVSLSCTMCPDVVQASQRISILNDKVTAAMIDLQYYPEIRDKFSIMSLPALIVNDNKVIFGRKNLEELVTILENGG
jgi:thioredoxin reductase (NADPH)